MKKSVISLRGMIVASVLSFSLVASSFAANKKTSVSQVGQTVTLTEDVDYIVSSATPFTDGGVVNIANTDHAVLILSEVRPKAAASLLSAHVQIAGSPAVNNVNCQVKIYNRGCIIMPYASNIKPLTVYSEQNFEGESVNSFGLENSNGFMNTLTDKKLNNRIRSFKLKRGYMVTFSLRADGRGYSRCFIADKEDLEVATLPTILDCSITSYRIFKWYDASKVGLAAAGGDSKSCDMLNATSTYTWGGASDMGANTENIPHHIYENYPSPSSLGMSNSSPHMKTNNEPMNTADDPKGKTESIDLVLSNWEDLMATGMRLCTPSSWDGSDYWNGTGYIKNFLDSIDARGWRCDIVDAHGYWNEANFGYLQNWYNNMHRPIWVSEWVWGASWNNNGIFSAASSRDNPTQADLEKNREVVERICNVMNNMGCVERYFYWNGEANCSKLILNGTLTPTGEMYSKLNSGVGYNKAYEYVPKIPKQLDPKDFEVMYDKATGAATLSFFEYNGEMNQAIIVQRRLSSNHSWANIDTLTAQEVPATYTYVDANAVLGCQYRIQIFDANGTQRTTKAAMAAIDDIKAGDVILLPEGTKYLGGNIFLNGDFEMGTMGWTNGLGEAISQPFFQVVPVGGFDGKTYLQCYGNGAATTAEALRTAFDIAPQADYYFTGASCNVPGVMSQLVLNDDGITQTQTIPGYFNNSTNVWQTKFATFNSGENTKCMLSFRSLGAKSQFDKLGLFRLFDSEADAIADAIQLLKAKAAMFVAYNTVVPELNNELNQTIAALSANDRAALTALSEAMNNAIAAYDILQQSAAIVGRAKDLVALDVYGSETLQAVITAFESDHSAVAIIANRKTLEEAMEVCMQQTVVEGKITNPSFAASSGWTTKCGTFTGGDQRINSNDGVTFWNAWWSGLSASEGEAQSMAIKQEVSGLDHGLYTLACKASTEHFCLTDQHGYITDGTNTNQTPALTADFYDLPSVSREDRWQELQTSPLYVADGGNVTIGFMGTKKNAIDDAWRRVGETSGKPDKREGWWCATDFQLLFSPLYRTTVEVGQWATRCLPYAVHPSGGMKFYQIVGVNPDYTAICIDEIQGDIPAGTPFIYRAEKAEVSFLEFGEPTNTAVKAYGNLRGFFKSSARVPSGYYVLADGKWSKVGTTRPQISYYTAVMRPFTDSQSEGVRILSDWAGLTIPIEGVTDAEKEANALGISSVTISNSNLPDGIYSIDGRSVVNGKTMQPGVYVRVQNGKAYKTIVR